MLAFCAHLNEASRGTKRWMRILGFPKWIITILHRMLTFSFYIRKFIVMSLFILIWATYEIYKCNTEDSYHTFSFAFAIFLVLFYWIYTAFIFWLALFAYKPDSNNPSRLDEFFAGLKPKKSARIHTVAILIRRIVYIVLFIVLVRSLDQAIIYTILFAQLGFVIYIIVLRPYEEIIVNIIEILGEVFYFAFLFWLVFLYKQKWLEFPKYLFLHVDNFYQYLDYGLDHVK